MSSRSHHAISSTGISMTTSTSSVANSGSSGGGGAAIATKEAEKAVPSVFEMPIPKWRPRLHPGSRALGAPDVYVRQADDPPPPEDELSEANVKNGLNTRPAVGNETFSAHDMIYDRLKGKAVVNQLSALFDEVVQRRAMLTSLRCGPVASQYRHPQRVTLNEVKLAAYVKELADPSVPLRKLARSVPHGYRGERMLDMLWNGGSLASVLAAVKQNPNGNGGSSSGANGSSKEARSPPSVSIERAVWFVRVVGASEISSSRLRQGKSGVYTAEWTSILMGWLRRQVLELNIVHHHHLPPSHHHHHLSAANSPASSSPHSSRTFVKQSPSQAHPATTPQRIEEPYALILDDDFRQRWMTKWNYSLALLRALLYESLIDVQVAARMAIEMLRTANIAQIYVVLALMEEFLGTILESITLSSFAVEVLCVKLDDFHHAEQQGKMHTALCKELRSVLSYCVDANSDNLILPSSWQKLSAFVAQGELPYSRLADHAVHERNSTLLNGFKRTIETGTTACHSQLEMLQVVHALDDLVNQDDVHCTFDAIFKRSPPQQSSVSPTEKIRAILLWSTTSWRCGSFRPFAGATLIHLYAQRQPKRFSKKSSSKPIGVQSTLQRLDLDAVITAWITDIDTTHQQSTASLRATHDGGTPYTSQPLTSVSIESLIILLGELCRTECFSIQKYIQRLTARGLTAMSGRDERGRPPALGAYDERGTAAEDGGGLLDSLHTKLLRSIPLFAPSAAIEHQRKVAIYGNRTKESREEAMERRAMREIQQTFAWIWSLEKSAIDEKSAEDTLSKFWTSSRHVRSRIIYRDILPALSLYVQQIGLPASQLSQVALLLAKADEYPALWQVVEDASKYSSDDEHIVSLVRFLFEEHKLAWIALDRKLPEPMRQSNQDTEAIAVAPYAVGHPSKRIARDSFAHWQEGRAFRSEDAVVPSAVCEVVFEELDVEEAKINVGLAEWLHALVKARRLDRRAFSILLCADILDRFQFSTSSLTLKKRMNSFAIELLANEVVNVEEWLTRLVLPHLEVEVKVKNKSNLLAILSPLSILFNATNFPAIEQEKDVRISHVCLAYLNSSCAERRSQLIRLVCFLAEIQDVVPDEASALRAAISSFDIVRSRVQSSLIDSARLIRQLAPSQHFHQLMTDFLPLQWSWTSDEQIVAQMGLVFERIDALRWQLSVYEVALLVDLVRRQTVRNGTEGGQLRSLARLTCNTMLKEQTETLTRFTVKELIGSEDGSAFANALLDERIKALNVDLEATFTDEKRIRQSVTAVAYLFESFSTSETDAISATNAVSQTFRLVTEWFENRCLSLSAATEGEEQVPLPSSDDGERHRSEESLVLHLGIVCMLLRFNGLLNGNNSAKALAPRLFYAILHIALAASWQADEDGGRVRPILDVATYLLQQSSVELQQAMQARAMEHLGVSLTMKPCPIEDVGKRLAMLLNLDTDGSSEKCSRMPPLVEAQSISSAFIDGVCLPVAFKPWDLHPNMDTNPTEAHHSLAAKTELNTLSNNGPVSLHLFAAHRTLDKIPNFCAVQSQADTAHGGGAVEAPGGITEAEFDERPPPALTSEETFGLHAGGTPIYARDAQRGLLALQVPSIGGLEVPLHLVPALLSDKAQTPLQHPSAAVASSTSTPKSSAGRFNEKGLITPTKAGGGHAVEKESNTFNGGGKKRKSYAATDDKSKQGLPGELRDGPSDGGAGSRKRVRK